MEQKLTALIVDDEERARKLLNKLLENREMLEDGRFMMNPQRWSDQKVQFGFCTY